MASHRSSIQRLALIFSAVVLLSSVPLWAAQGSIDTTNAGCTQVNGNVTYTSKQAVYVRGANFGASQQLYMRVSAPGGSLLGVPAGGFSNVTAAADGGLCVNLWSSVVMQSDNNSTGYDDTSNPGGEYVVEVSGNSDFTNSKHDNFKVVAEGTPTGTLHILKFYDANANGSYDSGEVLLSGWRVAVADSEIIPAHSWTDYNRTTPAVITGDPATYHAAEAMPNESNWNFVAATDAGGNTVTGNHVDTTIAGGDDKTVKFGNVCLGAGGGLTLGYWSNKNGQAATTAAMLSALSAMNLRKADGTDFNPANNKQLHDWLLSGTAVNMAYMLSVQMAAMELNVLSGGVNGNRLIYAPGASSANPFGYATVNALLNEANTSLGSNGYTPDGSGARAYQEALKNALDKGNNNLNFVQAQPCSFSFPQ
jgi:hypothetical protein